MQLGYWKTVKWNTNNRVFVGFYHGFFHCPGKNKKPNRDWKFANWFFKSTPMIFWCIGFGRGKMAKQLQS